MWSQSLFNQVNVPTAMRANAVGLGIGESQSLFNQVNVPTLLDKPRHGSYRIKSQSLFNQVNVPTAVNVNISMSFTWYIHSAKHINLFDNINIKKPFIIECIV